MTQSARSHVGGRGTMDIEVTGVPKQSLVIIQMHNPVGPPQFMLGEGTGTAVAASHAGHSASPLELDAERWRKRGIPPRGRPERPEE